MSPSSSFGNNVDDNMDEFLAILFDRAIPIMGAIIGLLYGYGFVEFKSESPEKAAQLKKLCRIVCPILLLLSLLQAAYELHRNWPGFRF